MEIMLFSYAIWDFLSKEGGVPDFICIVFKGLQKWDTKKHNLLILYRRVEGLKLFVGLEARLE